MTVDSDLSESIAALKQAFDKSGQEPTLGQAGAELLSKLEEKLRLSRRYRHLLAHGKLKQVAIAAIARESLGFLWAIAHAAAPTSAPS